MGLIDQLKAVVVAAAAAGMRVFEGPSYQPAMTMK